MRGDRPKPHEEPVQACHSLTLSKWKCWIVEMSHCWEVEIFGRYLMYHGLALGVLVPLLAWNPLVASLPLLVFARSWLALRCFNCSSFVACFFLHWLHCKVKKFLFQAISLYFEVSSTSSHSEGYRLSTHCHVESRVGWDLGSSLSFPSFLSVTFSSLDFGEHIKSCANSIAGT